MGVKGLWALLEPVGLPVNLECLEGKVIAVDISIWLNQSIKGIRDKRGVLAENSHILGLFNRICKLLFYKVKPVFVFDGGVPVLKRQTIEERRQRRENAQEKVKTNVSKVLKAFLSEKLSTNVEVDEDDGIFLDDDEVGLGLKKWDTKEPNLFNLPSEVLVDLKEKDDDSGAENEGNHWESFKIALDAQSELYDPALVDTESEDFKSLPPEIRHEILSEMKDKKRKWSRIDEIPTEREEFSSYQMKRVLTRRKIQQKLEEAEGEMVQSVSERASQCLGNDSYEGITAQRIMSDDASHFVFLNKRKTDNPPIGERLLKPAQIVIRESPKKSHVNKKLEDMFGEVNEYDFGISEAANKDGASTLRDHIKAEKPEPILVDLTRSSKPNHRPIPKVTPSVTREISDEDSETDSSSFEEVEEINIESDESTEIASPKNYESDKTSKEILPESVLLDEATIEECLKPFDNDDNTSSSQVEPAVLKRISSYSDPVPGCSKDPSYMSPSVISPPSSPEIVLEKSSASKKLPLESSINASPTKSKPTLEAYFSPRKDANQENSPKKIPVCTTPTKFGLSPDKLKSNDSPKTPTNRLPSPFKQPQTPLSPFDSTKKLINRLQKTPQKSPQKSPLTSPNKAESTNVNSFDQEFQRMSQEIKKVERQTSTVAYNMIADCRELLALFGIPYVMSPMEAEAQCAALELQGLTSGTITEDSDVWLFGGQTVYKNFFNQSKYVEMYRISDVEGKLKLDRETMICIALLTGCDYTDGVESVGHIKAVEILSEFEGHGFEKLKKFKEWWSEKRFGKDRLPGNKKRAQFLKLSLKESFPSEVVYKAFLNPTVLESNEAFSWAIPDLDLLREYAATKMKWSREKIDSVLTPIIKKLNQKQTQMRMDQFLTGKSNSNRLFYTSKRLAEAVNKISKTSSPDGKGGPVVEALTHTAKLPVSKLREKVKNQRRKGRIGNDADGDGESQKAKPSKLSKGKGRGRGRGRGKKPNITIELSESSSDGD